MATRTRYSAARCRVRAIYVFSAYHSPTESAAIEAYMRQRDSGAAEVDRRPALHGGACRRSTCAPRPSVSGSTIWYSAR